MPNCFTLTRKGETEPARLSAIDDAMCAHFNVTPDADRYYRFWVDIEGCALACGRDWDWIRANMDDEEGSRKPIVDFLEANYTPDCWAEIGRR